MRSEFKKRIASFKKQADPSDYIGELINGQYQQARDFEHLKELIEDKIEKLETLFRMQESTNREEMDQDFVKESIELMKDYMKWIDDDKENFEEYKARAVEVHGIKDIDFGKWDIPGLKPGTFKD